MQMLKSLCQGLPSVDRIRLQDRGHLRPLLRPPRNAGQVLCLKSANGFAVAVLFVWWCWESKRLRSHEAGRFQALSCSRLKSALNPMGGSLPLHSHSNLALSLDYPYFFFLQLRALSTHYFENQNILSIGHT